MELQQALEQAIIILRDEQKRPKLNYEYVADDWLQRPSWLLMEMRKVRPREVWEDPADWRLESVNYRLITAIFIQLAVTDREEFLRKLLRILIGAEASPLLLAEFCVRHGYLDLLIGVFEEFKMPTQSVALAITGLEETIALNFNVFSLPELKAMPKALAKVREIADLQTWSVRPGRGGVGTVSNPVFQYAFSALGKEIVKAIDCFLDECNQALYWYTKGALEQSRSLEIEGDKKRVEDYLTTLGFSSLMLQSLHAAEQLFTDAADPFELKSCLGHLRSFLERLHIEACPPLAVPGDALPMEWGSATLFLRSHFVITIKEEQFITKLYTLVSDEAIHPLIAEREYARLFRNIVIEYGLLFLTILQKRGITISS